jgi:hypothetical protein
MPKLKSISKNDSISLDLVCYLPSITISEDEIGNQIKTPVDRLVYCAELPINSSEFYNAGQAGIKPEKLLAVDLEEYDGETSVLYQDIRYNIYRSYPRSDGFIELYCNKKAGV